MAFQRFPRRRIFVSYLGNPTISVGLAVALTLVFIVTTQREAQFFLVIAVLFGVFGVAAILAYLRARKVISSVVPGLFKHYLIQQEISILNSNGDAELIASFLGQYKGTIPLSTMKAQLSYDGLILEDNDVSCFLNGVSQRILPLTHHAIEDLKKRRRFTRTELSFAISPSLRRNTRLAWAYKANLHGGYANAFYDPQNRPDAEDTHTTPIQSVTKELRIIMKLNRLDKEWSFQKFEIKVADALGNMDTVEESRIRLHHFPKMCADKRTIDWKISLPILGYRYTLSFSIMRFLT